MRGKDLTYNSAKFLSRYRTIFILFFILFMSIKPLADLSFMLLEIKYEYSQKISIDDSEKNENDESTEEDNNDIEKYFNSVYFYKSYSDKQKITFFDSQDYILNYDPDIQLPPPKI